MNNQNEALEIAIESALHCRGIYQSESIPKQDDILRKQLYVSEDVLKDIISISFMYELQDSHSEKEVSSQILELLKKESGNR